MNSETQQANRRRRGGRRPRGGRGGYRTPDRANSPSPSPASRAASEKKPGFLKRIFGILFGKKPQTPPSSVYGRVIETPEPRAPRNAGSPRPARASSNGSPAEEAPRTNGETAAPRPPRVARKPELVEVTSAKLYVGNLSFDATESDLTELFSGVGSVQSSEVVSHRETQRSKGFAFVTMNSVEEAKRAVETLHDQEFMGRKLVVSGAKTSDVR